MPRRSRPSSRMVPAVGASAPTIARMSVVLPAPFRPTMPHSDPVGASRETPRRIGVAPMPTSRRAISSMAGAAGDVLAHAEVGEHGGGVPIGQDAALVKGDHAGPVALDDVDVVLDEDDGDLARGESSHDD